MFVDAWLSEAPAADLNLDDSVDVEDAVQFAESMQNAAP